MASPTGLPDFMNNSYISKLFNLGENKIVPMCIESVLMIIGIVLLNNYSHNNMLTTSKPEFAVFITLLIFIIYLFIEFWLTVYNVTNDADNPNYTKIKNFILGMFDTLLLIPLQFILWNIINIYANVQSFFKYFFDIFIGIFNDDSSIKLLPLYAILFIFIIAIFVIINFAANDSSSLSNKSWVYFISIIIPLLICIGLFYQFRTLQQNTYYYVFIAILIAVFVLTILYFYSSVNLQTFTTISFIINGLLFIILLMGLAMFFYMFSNYLKSFDGLTGFMIYFIFYIPCLLIEFFKYIRNEFAMTSNLIYIMFVCEVLLILLYVFVPQLINYIAYSDGIVLLKDSMFLDSQKIIGNSTQFVAPRLYSDFNDNINVQNINYSFSMWIYLNEQPNNYSAYSSERTIFDYGNGKPKLTYFNNLNSDKDKDKYIIYFTNQTTDTYEITLPSQKWNNIVFNYSSSKVDLYVNGNLERTFIFNDNAPTYDSADVVTVGSNDGLYGAICNVRYYSTPLSSYKISNSYNLLMFKNPPTISL